MSTQSAEAETVEAGGNTTFAALAHASALISSFLGPILFLVLADDDDELVKQNAKNSINFQILIFIAFLVSGALTIVLIGLFMVPIVALIDLILVLIATIKANNGEVYKYPYTPDIV